VRRCILFSRLDEERWRCIKSLRGRATSCGRSSTRRSAVLVIERREDHPGPRAEAHHRDPGAGDFFGELALLDGADHSATAIALEATEALVLRRDAFDRLVDEDPGLRRALFAGLVGELRRLTYHVGELHFLNLPGRLARRIVRMAREAARTPTESPLWRSPGRAGR
jgi:CRP-like cAMP-binding protein